MSDKPKFALGLQKDVIKSETAEGANSALRIGQMFEDLIDSMLTLQDNLSSSLNSSSTNQALTLAAGKALKDLCDNLQAQIVSISLILQSNDINLDEFQEIVDAIKALQEIGNQNTFEYKVAIQPIANVREGFEKAGKITKVVFGATLTSLKIQINGGVQQDITPTSGVWEGEINFPANAAVLWIPTASEAYTYWIYSGLDN